MLSFGDKLKALLSEKQITQKAYAEAVGVDRMTISHLIQGRRSYSQRDIEKLVETYPEVDLNWLLKSDEQASLHQGQESTDATSIKVQNAALKKKMQELLNKIQ